MFQLEPIGLFVGGQKMMSETGNHIQFWAHCCLAREYYQDHKILSPDQFDQVEWRSVHSTLHGLPHLFQLWASKHVLGIAGTMTFLSHQDNRSPICPSCQSMQRDLQAHCALPGRREDCHVCSVHPRGQTMDDGPTHPFQPHTSSSEIFTGKRDSLMP